MNLSMQVEERTFLKRIDFNFAFVILALNLVGLINLYSATHGIHSTNEDLFWSQIIWLFMGWFLYFVLTLIDYRIVLRWSYLILALNILALLLVKFHGKSFYGAQRWLDLGIFRYQPSETIKLALILVLARHLAGHKKLGQLGLKDLVIPAVLILIPFGLTVVQPDLGSALLIGAISFSMILFIGVKRKIFVMGVIIAVVGALLTWEFGMRDYQRNRVETFLDPGKDPRGAGYNSIQSKIAVGSGRLLGKGFRKGTQSQLEFLPERHTDFIYSVLSEEHGFVGSVFTVILFAILFLMGLNVATQAKDKAGALIVVGVLIFIFWHMFVNIGMVIGILPIVGVPLPLLSYGGSGMFSVMAGLGFVSSVAYRKYLF